MTTRRAIARQELALRTLRGFVRLVLFTMGAASAFTPSVAEACDRLEEAYRAQREASEVGPLPAPVRDVFGPVWWTLRGPWPVRVEPASTAEQARQQLQESKLVEKLQQAMATRPDLRLPPSPGQLDFHRDQARLRYVMAGNQVGKTIAGAREVHWFATKTHPYRNCVHRKSEGWVCVASFEGKAWRSVCKALYDTCDRDAIDWERSHYDEVNGWRNRVIVYRNGYIISFVSSKAGSTSAASGSIDFLWVDEPPKQHVWGELLGRLRSTHGPIWMTLTPYDSEADLRWLQVYLEGDTEQLIPPQGDWSKTVISFELRNVPWMTEEEIEEEIELVPLDQQAQRVYGEWEGVVADRSLRGFSEANVCELALSPQDGWTDDGGEIKLVVWTDHGTLPGRQVFLLVAYQALGERYRLSSDRVDHSATTPQRFGRRIRARVLAEYLNPETTSEEQDAAAVRDALDDIGLSVDMLDYGVGDTNNAGKSRGGRSLNAVYQNLFRSMMSPAAAPRFVMHSAIKGPGMERFQVNLINGYLGRGDLSVHPRCKATIRAMRRWTGKNDDYKHIIDTLRYGVHEMDRREGFPAQQIRVR